MVPTGVFRELAEIVRRNLESATELLSDHVVLGDSGLDPGKDHGGMKHEIVERTTTDVILPVFTRYWCVRVGR